MSPIFLEAGRIMDMTPANIRGPEGDFKGLTQVNLGRNRPPSIFNAPHTSGTFSRWSKLFIESFS